MLKVDYLKRCVTAVSPLENHDWYVYMLGIPLPTTQDWQTLPPLTPYCQNDGMYYVDQDPQSQAPVLTKIVDAKPGQPVFHIQELIDVDNSWLPTIAGQFKTKLGNLLINTVALYPSIGATLPYQDGPIQIKTLESKFGKLMVDDDAPAEGYLTVSQINDCMDRLWFFAQLSNLINIAVTPKLISRAPGTKELRKKLLKENEDKLTDPAVVASIAKQLEEHDRSYLAGDPVAEKGLSKKGSTARRKLHQMYGETNDFDASLTSDPIKGSMDEGLDHNEKDLAKYINDLRYASYSRGHSTQLAGYTYKILQRSISGIDVVDTPCSTQKGYPRLITERNTQKSVGRYFKPNPTDKQWSLMESSEQAGKYLGKVLTFRSAMYCTSGGNTICYACLGESFKGSGSAMTTLASSISSEFMTLFLKRMHTSGFGLTKIEKKDLVT